MEFHIARDGQQSGPFSQEEVRRKLSAGELQPTDRGWQEGMAEWMPLSTFPMLVATAPPMLTTSGGVTMYQPATTCGMAVASLVMGIVSFTLFPFLPSILAVVFGHAARSSIRQSQGRLVGDGLAVAGLVLGYIGVGLLVLGIAIATILLFTVGLAAAHSK